MLRVLGGTICLVFCYLLIIFVPSVQAAHNQFVCDLEVNKVGPKPANTKANGNVIFLLDEEKKELSYKIQVENIQDVYMVHLHMGPPNKEGIIATWLYPKDDHDSPNRTIKGKFTGTLAEGIIRQEDLRHGITFEKFIEFLSNGNAYVNVHTEKFVMGSIRGQVYSEDFASRMEQNPKAAGIK